MDPSKGPLEPSSLPKVKIGSKQKFTVPVAQEKDAAVLPDREQGGAGASRRV